MFIAIFIDEHLKMPVYENRFKESGILRWPPMLIDDF